MANSFSTSTWLSMTSLDLLLNKLAVANIFNKAYSKEFKQRFPVGDSITVPYPFQPRIRQGLPYNPDSITRRQATITVEPTFGVDFEWDSDEQALYMPRGRAQMEKEILEPAMAYIAQEIDSKAAQYAYQNAAGLVGVLGTDPTSFDASSAAARQKMVELGCPPTGERAFIVPPRVMRALKASSISYFNPVTDISKQFRTGIVGSGDGFEWYESMSLYRHTAGTWAGAVTVTTAPVDGATTLALTCTTGDTFKKGDKFSVAATLPVNMMTRRTFGTDAKTFTITADVTGVASAATITFSPPMYGPLSQSQNVDALPLAAAALTLWPGTASPNGKSGTVSVAIHENAFALVGIELENPKSSSVEIASQSTDPDSGISVAFVRQFDGNARKFINRFDVKLGFGTFYNDSCAIAIAGA